MSSQTQLDESKMAPRSYGGYSYGLEGLSGLNTLIEVCEMADRAMVLTLLRFLSHGQELRASRLG